MGMWSRPSKQHSEGGQIGFPSPHSPPPFFGDTSTASINDDDNTTTTTPAPTATAAPTAAANGGGSATATQLDAAPAGSDSRREHEGGSDRVPAATTDDLGTSNAVDPDSVGGEANRAAGEPSLAQVGPVTPVRAARRVSGATGAGTTPVARSPEIGAREGPEALLLVRG